MTTPGIHKAMHTSAKILHPGAWLDFASYMNSLIAQGRVLDARSLWGSVFEVMHMGVDPCIVTLDVGRPGMLPPIRRVPCTATNCERCQTGRGGFQFPFVGCWMRRAVVVQDGIVSPQAAWEVFHAGETVLISFRSAWWHRDSAWKISSPSMQRGSAIVLGLAEMGSAWAICLQLGGPGKKAISTGGN